MKRIKFIHIVFFVLLGGCSNSNCTTDNPGYLCSNFDQKNMDLFRCSLERVDSLWNGFTEVEKSNVVKSLIKRIRLYQRDATLREHLIYADDMDDFYEEQLVLIGEISSFLKEKKKWYFLIEEARDKEDNAYALIVFEKILSD
ncbi:hypothetical protein PPO43_15040 [Saprospira sp. CCB-QB6]|uniref:hypothetical protein n=1 Tax=Saprospira sp. CCB-QB6 TaxID=3023936 RepID=UPI0023498C38|nr:hypothetical protein [Saprospira sp. CCB-QB6]WCL81289.1 hypothetical protein PPO43_15040 [Saprospira sp. CCB-QB6]